MSERNSMPLSDKRVFFGHQSVGANIIEGISRLPGHGQHLTHGQPLNIAETRSPEECTGPGLIHALVGRNQDPESKIKDFAKLMHEGFGNNVDIACFKLCYIDINRATHVEQLFSEYKNTLDKLISQYDKTKFLHITVPLRTVEPGVRLFMKRLLGKKSIALADNWKRQQFNAMIRETYGDIFDLALAESTDPAGKGLSHTFEGDLVYSLLPAYTDDGGHLNKLGQKIIAQQFVDCLAKLN